MHKYILKYNFAFSLHDMQFKLTHCQQKPATGDMSMLSCKSAEQPCITYKELVVMVLDYLDRKSSMRKLSCQKFSESSDSLNLIC